ncbi:MAG: FAD-dependent oxidoreductase [Candidatus Omnitrophica bacterium]|nr:FAD-dependent oxidoreductase [Candidatus Omnitrophota bacterium]
MRKADFLFIGNGVASNSALDAIRERDKKSSVVIVGEEDFDFYYRPQLADYLLGRVTDEQIKIRRQKYYESQNAELIKNSPVIKIDAKNKEVCLKGEVIKYSKMLIATGLSPYKSDFGFQSISDVKKVQAHIEDAANVFVAGEYVFVLELIRALIGKNKKITYLCRGSRLLEGLLDERASRYLEGLFTTQGVSLIYQNSIGKIDTSDGKCIAQIRHIGESAQPEGRICADICFIADYQDKNKAMFINADIDCAATGIWVDRHMKTNSNDIYAAGDVARVRDGYPPHALRVGWQRARNQGRAAGLNMIGEPVEFNPLSSAIHIRFGDINFLFAGEMPSEDRSFREDIILESTPDNYYKRIHIDEGMVKGFVFVGGIRGLARAKELLENGIKLGSAEKFVLHRELQEGVGDSISSQMACPTCKTILDLPINIEVDEKVVCEVCGAESAVSRTRVSKVRYLRLA